MKRIVLLIATLTFFETTNYAQTFTDIDGNMYNTVTIGTQVWMKENLKVSHYTNGDPIPEVKDSLAWLIQTKGAWCNNENKPANGIVYGKLYNWHAANDLRGIAPKGWHVPSDAEWKTLEMYVGMLASTTNLENYRGTKEANALKKADTTTYWTLACCPTPGLSKNKGTNSSGFTALGAGYRIYFNAGGSYTSFQKPTGNAQFWTSTAPNDSTAWLRHLCVYHEDIFRDHWPKVNGSSIRLIKDTAPASTNEMKKSIAIDIYPNPAIDKVLFTNANKQDIKMKVYNTVGVCVFQKDLITAGNEIDISSWAKGVYLVKFTSMDGTLEKRLIKE